MKFTDVEFWNEAIDQKLLVFALLIAGIGLYVLIYGGCGPSYDVVTIDGCQYIGTRWSSHRTLVHKANCPNHRSAP